MSDCKFRNLVNSWLDLASKSEKYASEIVKKCGEELGGILYEKEQSSVAALRLAANQLEELLNESED